MVAGLGALGFSLALAIYVLVPKNDLQFALDGAVAHRVFFGYPSDPRAAQLDLAEWLDKYRKRNEPAISRLTAAFRGASLAVFAEIAFFALALTIP